MSVGIVIGSVAGGLGLLSLVVAAYFVSKSTALTTASENYRKAAESWKSRYDSEKEEKGQLQARVAKQDDEIVELKARVMSLERVATARPEVIALGKLLDEGINKNERRHEENLGALTRTEGSLSLIQDGLRTSRADAHGEHELIRATALQQHEQTRAAIDQAVEDILAAIHSSAA